jgi:hypothetical protein
MVSIADDAPSIEGALAALAEACEDCQISHRKISVYLLGSR